MPNIIGLQAGLDKYATSVDNVEDLTSFDFFSALPDLEQEDFEAPVNQSPRHEEQDLELKSPNE